MPPVSSDAGAGAGDADAAAVADAVGKSAPVGRGERLAVGIVLLVAPLVLLAISRDGGYSELAAVSPMFFPAGVLWGWTAVAALALVAELHGLRADRAGRAAKRPASAGVSSAGIWWRIAIVTLAMLGFVLLVTWVGFLLSAIGFTTIALVTLGSRSVSTILLYGVLMPGVLFGVFHHALGLPLPTSPFSYLF